MAPLLHMQHITKRYPGVIALDDVNLEVHAGEVLCLVGENGAGKSTLMRILSGAHPMDSGRVMIDGNEVHLDSPAAAQRLGVGMIYQDLKLIPELTIAENITLGHEPHNGLFLDKREMTRIASSALHRLGERTDVGLPVLLLRIAQQQLVSIARAISRNVRILVLDEPTASLTRHEIRNLFDVIKKLASDGVGVIYISHRLEEIFEIADRIAVLRDGKLVHISEASALDRPALITMMVGRTLENEYPAFDHIPGAEILTLSGIATDRVQNVHLTLRRGEVLGLAGLVGAGRTELANVIFGADERTAGTMMLDGIQFTPQSPRDAIDAGIGLLTEDRNRFGLIMEMNVRENITLSHLGSLMSGPFVKKPEERILTEKYVQQLHIKTRSIEHKVSTLSGGNRQKVVLARWLLTKAKVLIFDEPTNGIDVGVRFEIYRIIHQLAADGLGIIVISSDMLELLGICDRIVVMSEGRVAGELGRNEATQERIMELAAQ